MQTNNYNEYPKILIYTREKEEGDYPNGLANSIHFAYAYKGHDFQPLNHNYGILFAKGEISFSNTIIERGVINPCLFYTNEQEFEILGTQVDQQGNPGVVERILRWTSKDLIHFSAQETIDKDMNLSRFHQLKQQMEQLLKVGEKVSIGTAIKGAIPGNEIQVSAQVVEKLCQKWNPEETLKEQDPKPGSINESLYNFPLAIGYADPQVFFYKGKWYFIATNDNTDAVGLFVREGDRVEDLFAPDTKEYLILDYDERRELIQTFWAPEFHEINGALYILFAVGGKAWSPQSHVMKLKEGGSIIQASDWEDPVRVCKEDGSYLATEGITLDMTYLQIEGSSFLVWSYREGINTKADTGSMLYIATIDPQKPWILTSQAVLLSRPLYGWENMEGTINNEGPYGLVTKEKVFLLYSGGAAGGYSYALGMLTLEKGKNPLDAQSWEKSCAPLLTHYTIEGQYGPGHHTFYINEDGEVMIVYHAQRDKERSKRCTAIGKVHFDKEGYPFFLRNVNRGTP